MKQLSKHTVLIASAGRTGTKFLGDQLGKIIHNSFSIHEADAIHLHSIKSLQEDLRRIKLLGIKQTITGKLTRKTGTRNLALNILSGKLTKEEAGQEYARQRRRMHEKRSEELIIESYGTLSAVLKAAPFAFKNWKGIGIVRDPRTWIRSWEGHRRTRFSDKDLIQKFGLGRYSPENIPGDPIRPVWRKLSTRERLAWYWGSTTKLLMHAEDENDNVRIFRFEGIFSSALAMDQLVDFCAHFPDRQFSYKAPQPFMQKKINESSRLIVSDWHEWPAREVYAVNFFCGKYMDRLGYERDQEWLDTAALGRESSPLARIRNLSKS